MQDTQDLRHERMMTDRLIQLGQRASRLIFVSPPVAAGAFAHQWQQHFRKPVGAVLLVADQGIQAQAEQLLKELGPAAKVAWVAPGETSKSAAALMALYDQLANMKADRATPVIAMGGGVVGDLAGFAAATWNRGLPLVMVPTTLLAMVDSSIGGKVAINHPRGKNLIGAFHQPSLVWFNLAYLETLPDREFRSGLAEVVKYGMILDAVFFEYLESHVDAILDRQPEVMMHLVRRSCELKAQVVVQDEFETTGERAKLNYGHTFGHAYEAVAGYGTLTHGEAIAIGMMTEAKLAQRLGRVGPELIQRQENLLSRFGLPTVVDPNWPAEPILEAILRDKKNLGGQVRMVLPSQLGTVALVPEIPLSLVQQVAHHGG